MNAERLRAEQKIVRAERRREHGVEYKLRVIEGSGGMLELVEKPPRSKHWFHEWARLMYLTGGMF